MHIRSCIEWIGHGVVACLIGMLVACTTANDDGNMNGVACTPGAFGCATAGVGGAGATSGVDGAAGTTAGMFVAGIGGVGGVAGQGTLPSTDGVPCDVATVISARCTGCHSARPKFGAIMPLMTYADFQANAVRDPARKVYQVIPERIDPLDVALRMPPTSLDALPQVEKDTLNAWLSVGAPAAAAGQACVITEANIVPVDPADGGVISTSSGKAHVEPIEYDDPDMQCYKFVAHGSGSDTAPYMKSPGEAYMNFDFKAPWTGTMYQRSIKLVIDPDSQVIHHWLLFKQTGPVTDGAISTGSGTHPDGILLHGWAPGASPLYLDPDVGVVLEGDVGYRLEVHYYNGTGSPGADASGAEICVTPHMPEHIAELSWVGTDSIFGTSAQGTCNPSSSEPIHLIAAQPHMHLKGRHMQVIINRADGSEQMLHDEDFMFENQRYYVLDSMLMPGDTMTTRCTYSEPAQFGSSTNQEMCYFFTMHWPAGALRSPGIGTALHGANSCL
jgi:hypothetical protein